MASRATRLRVNVAAREFRRCGTYKMGYLTRGEALDAAERLMHAGRVDPGCHITPYACPECGEWHVANRVVVQIPGRRVKARGRDAATR